MYRFYPSVRFRTKYPSRERIVEVVTRVWKQYRLDERTEFNVRVQKVWRNEKTGKWFVEDKKYGEFDGIIAAVGTCGAPKVPHVPGQEKFKGEICHSSQLTGKEDLVRGKNVAVIGGGASAVEAVEFAVDVHAAKTNILARVRILAISTPVLHVICQGKRTDCTATQQSDKWIIPRNPVVDVLLAADPLGEETSLSWIPEGLLKRFFYRDLADLAPAKAGLFTETPMVNDKILQQVRAGSVAWLRGDIQALTEHGIQFTHRLRGVPKGGPGKEEVIPADVIIMATGFQRPSLKFLPEDAFKPAYMPPNWFLQTFPVGYPTICATNCTYVNAIGTVGNIHIGIYTRILLMFVADPATRPSTAWMRAWVDLTRVFKRGAPGGALDFFTYHELMWWFLLCLIMNPLRWKWALFVMTGWGSALPKNKRGEAQVNNGA